MLRHTRHSPEQCFATRHFPEHMLRYKALPRVHASLQGTSQSTCFATRHFQEHASLQASLRRSLRRLLVSRSWFEGLLDCLLGPPPEVLFGKTRTPPQNRILGFEAPPQKPDPERGGVPPPSGIRRGDPPGPPKKGSRVPQSHVETLDPAASPQAKPAEVPTLALFRVFEGGGTPPAYLVFGGPRGPPPTAFFGGTRDP
jgi:hypothetical protein